MWQGDDEVVQALTYHVDEIRGLATTLAAVVDGTDDGGAAAAAARPRTPAALAHLAEAPVTTSPVVPLAGADDADRPPTSGGLAEPSLISALTRPSVDTGDPADLDLQSVESRAGPPTPLA